MLLKSQLFLISLFTSMRARAQQKNFDFNLDGSNEQNIMKRIRRRRQRQRISYNQSSGERKIFLFMSDYVEFISEKLTIKNSDFSISFNLQFSRTIKRIMFSEKLARDDDDESLNSREQQHEECSNETEKKKNQTLLSDGELGTLN